MDKLYRILKGAVIAGMVLVCHAAALAQPGHAVITCTEPGTLRLSKEALAAKYLTVKGDLDARDFATLKTVTVSSIHTLDLGDVRIHEYTGHDGTYPPSLSPDWIVGPGDGPVTYPADYFPSYFATETRDNSLSKYHMGSTTLTSVVIPRSLKGFMPYAFKGDKFLSELKVPEGSEYLVGYGEGVYTKDKKELVAVAPGYCGHLSVPAATTSVRDYVLQDNHLASITFEGEGFPAFGKENPLECAYVVCGQPEAFNSIYPDVDCFERFEIVEVECDAPGQLMAKLGDMGFTRSDVRGVKVSGSLGYDDLTSLLALPNLHHADLASAMVSESEGQNLRVDNPAMTYLTLPEFDSWLSFTLTDNTHFHGHLDVSERIEWVDIYALGVSSVVLPSSIWEIAEYCFDETQIKKADLSKCSYLKKLKYVFRTCPALEEIFLPTSISDITGIQGPVKSINLPDGLKTLYSPGEWMIESLVLPQSLETFSLTSLPIATSVDASKARNLNGFYGLNNSPLLESLDIATCPVIYFNAFSADEIKAEEENVARRRSPSKIVVTGGTRYPEPKLCALKDLRLPSTLGSFVGVTNCHALENLDLIHCFRLQQIEGMNFCPNLKSISLPSSITKVNGLYNCPSMQTIKTACQTPPAVMTGTYGWTPLDFSKVSAYVPKGRTGAYRMAEGWENCREILEGGHVVTISLDECAHLFSNNTSAVNVNGAGLYADGETARLEAFPSAWFSASGWNLNGEWHPGSSMDVAVTADMVASPVYGEDYSLCDLVIAIDAPVAQNMKLNIGSYKRNVILNGNLINNYLYDNFNDTQLSFYLEEGTNTLAINGDYVILQFDQDNGVGKDDHFAITSFDINNKNSLRYLYPTYFKMDRLEIKDNSAFGYLASRGENQIREVVVENCPQLDEISLVRCGLENLSMTGIPIKYLGVWNNNLTSLDLTEFRSLIYVDAESNRLVDFKMDAPECEYLYLSDNPMAFSTLTPQMYDIYMRNGIYEIGFIIEDSDIDPAGSVDLSAQMFPPECGARTNVQINSQPGQEVGNGVFKVVPGRTSYIYLTNDAFPGLRYAASIYLDNSGVEGTETDADQSAPVEVYDIQGRKVNAAESRLPAGLYIIRQGGNARKVMK